VFAVRAELCRNAQLINSCNYVAAGRVELCRITFLVDQSAATMLSPDESISVDHHSRSKQQNRRDDIAHDADP